MFDPPPGSPFEPIEGDNGRTWRRISDFRPGIHTAIAPSRPSGQAQEDGTFQCYASSAGSLIPGPRLVQRITRPTTDYTASALVNEQFRIVGLHANAPVYSVSNSNANTTGVFECHTELFMAVEYWTSSGGDVLNLDVSRYTRNTVTPAWEQVWSRTYPAGTYSSTTRPRNCVFGSQRSNSANVNAELNSIVSGPSVVVFAFTGNGRIFPADTSTYVTGTAPLPADDVDDPVSGIAPTDLVCHQGRVIVFPLYITGDGDDQVYISSECAYWTPFNNATVLEPNLTTYLNILGGYEQAAGYGAHASLTADELFLVKVRGGGLMVSGPLDSRVVRTLPYVRSTGLSFCNGIVTPFGFAYPVDGSGIWLWTGGDTSEQVTKHLTPQFWRPSTLVPTYADPDNQTAAEWGYQNTQAAQWNEFSLFPNNWFWDTDEKGWWRILDPDVIPLARWVADERGVYAWASPHGYTASADPVIYEFSRFSSATFMSWRSHPQSFTVDRTFTCDELVVCAQGSGQVRVTVETPEDPNNPATAIVSVTDPDRPQLLRTGIKAAGSAFTFTIESIGSDHDEALGSIDMDATVAAPTVHWVDWSTIPSNQLPNAQ
jgi:hypothetical protein